MVGVLFSFALLSSPYPFEVKSGFVLEATTGYFFQDTQDKDKMTGGLRISHIRPDETDTIITAEVQALTALTFAKPGGDFQITRDYFFESGFVFYEIFNPMAFRLSLGGGIEIRDSNTSLDMYYRGGLGRYFTEYFGVFVELSGRLIFRDNKTVYPFELSPSFQFIF